MIARNGMWLCPKTEVRPTLALQVTPVARQGVTGSGQSSEWIPDPLLGYSVDRNAGTPVDPRRATGVGRDVDRREALGLTHDACGVPWRFLALGETSGL